MHTSRSLKTMTIWLVTLVSVTLSSSPVRAEPALAFGDVLHLAENPTPWTIGVTEEVNRDAEGFALILPPMLVERRERAEIISLTRKWVASVILQQAYRYSIYPTPDSASTSVRQFRIATLQPDRQPLIEHLPETIRGFLVAQDDHIVARERLRFGSSWDVVRDGTRRAQQTGVWDMSVLIRIAFDTN